MAGSRASFAGLATGPARREVLFALRAAPFFLRFSPDVFMIRVENLTKYFGPVQAVDHISFSVARGEIVGFLGPNGAGKTTSMRILTTFLPASEGSAKVAGFDVMTQSMQVRQNIGYLPESVPLYPEMR